MRFERRAIGRSVLAPKQLASQLLAVQILGLCACGPPLPDGMIRLMPGQSMLIAKGMQRFLVPFDAARGMHAVLRPPPGEFAALAASICQLDPHRRIDEGDHCVGQEVTVGRDGASEVQIPPQMDASARKFNGLAFRIYSLGASADGIQLSLE